MTDIPNNRFLDIDELLTGLGLNVLGSIRDPFGIIAPDYTILWLNKAMGFIHGKPHDGAKGKVCYHYFYDKKKPCEDCPLSAVFSEGKTHIVERYLDFPDGIRWWGEVKAYPIRNKGDMVNAAIVIVFDITARKKASEKNMQSSNSLFKKPDGKNDKFQTIHFDNGDITIKISLTGREKEVLQLLTDGLTNTQISDMLNISPSTVKTHIINIFNKLSVNDRTQAAVMAIRYNLI